MTDQSEVDSDESMGDMDHEQLYQEVDANHESIYEPRRPIPPLIKIERKTLQGGHLYDSLLSSSNNSEEMLERAHVVSLTHAQTRGHNGSLDNSDDFVVSEDITPITLTPRSPRTPLTPFLPDAPPSTPTNFFNAHYERSSVSAIATLPRMKKDKPKPTPLKLTHSAPSGAHLAPSRELIQGVEIQVHHFTNSVPSEVGVRGERSSATHIVSAQAQQVSSTQAKPSTVSVTMVTTQSQHSGVINVIHYIRLILCLEVDQ